MIRVILLLTLAAVVGFGTVKLAQGWLESERAATVQPVAQAQPEITLTQVLVADHALAVGSFVKPEDLRWQAWPDEALVDGYVVEGVRTLEEFAGSVVRTSIAAGEPITDTRVVKPGDRGFLAAVLTPGMRAVSVPVDARSGIAGLIFPGDRVDLILTHTVDDEQLARRIADDELTRTAGAAADPSTGEPAPQQPVVAAAMPEMAPTGAGEGTTHRASETVMQDIRILAIDQRLDAQDGVPQQGSTVTIEVTPRQAERIGIILEMGTLSLALRSLADPEEMADAALPAAPSNDPSADPSATGAAAVDPVGLVAEAPAKIGEEGKTALLGTEDATMLGFAGAAAPAGAEAAIIDAGAATGTAGSAGPLDPAVDPALAMAGLPADLRTYTLDSDVSQLLAPPGLAQHEAEAEPVVTVFRGSVGSGGSSN